MKPQLDEVIFERDLHRYDGLRSKSQRAALIKAGKYPSAIKLSERKKVWLRSEIAKWQANRIAETRAGRPHRASARGWEARG